MQKIPVPGEEGYNLFYNTMYYARLLREVGKIEQKVADLKYRLTLFQTTEERKRLEAELWTEEIRLKAMDKKKEKAKKEAKTKDLSMDK